MPEKMAKVHPLKAVRGASEHSVKKTTTNNYYSLTKSAF